MKTIELMKKRKATVKHWWLSSEVKDAYTINTGGNIRNDILILKNKQVVVITSDGVYLFNSLEDYEDNKEKGCLYRCES